MGGSGSEVGPGRRTAGGEAGGRKCHSSRNVRAWKHEASFFSNSRQKKAKRQKEKEPYLFKNNICFSYHRHRNGAMMDSAFFSSNSSVCTVS